MSLKLTHEFNESLLLFHEEQLLFRYVYIPDMPQLEAPKPYFHPVYSLTGNMLTTYRPHDHIWHKGIQMTLAHLSDQNFWGGGTYVHGQGYVQLPNNGSMVHNEWYDIRCDEESATFFHNLTWITQAGDKWIDEDRRFAVNDLDADEGYWTLDYQTRLTNISGQTLTIGSPTTQGRPQAGYGGLFWRGPRSFRHGDVLGADDQSSQEIMGHEAAWLAYSGLHDVTRDRSTLIFLDHPQNIRYPNKWFVRSDPFACASFAFMFDEELDFGDGDALDLKYRIVFANGGWERERIESYAQRWQES